MLRFNTGSKYAIPFHQDGPRGREDPVNSLSIILDWMSTGNNYSLYCGDEANQGTSKLQYAKDIIDIMEEKGCWQVRKPHDVVQKMRNLRKLYQRANEWKNRTGQGHLAEGRLREFKEGLKAFCPFFDLLNPILGTCCNVKGIYNWDDADLICPVVVEAPDNAVIDNLSKIQWLVANLHDANNEEEEKANKEQNQEEQTTVDKVTVINNNTTYNSKQSKHNHIFLSAGWFGGAAESPPGRWVASTSRLPYSNRVCRGTLAKRPSPQRRMRDRAT